MARGNLFFHVRILVLLLVLFLVALGTWVSQMRVLAWDEPLWMAIHVINGDNLQRTQDYIDTLDEEDFTDIQEFMQTEAEAFGLNTEGILNVRFVGQIDAVPPEPPFDGNVIQIALWSLKLRWWAHRNAEPGPAQIRMFVKYFDPWESPRLAHSLGLRKGRIGVVNAFATKHMARTNNVIIAHEMLHTVGATDKYIPDSNYPLWPTGFAEPERQPVLPQRWAALMAGRIPTTENDAETPTSLDQVVIGEATALELRWIE